jgi:hypothetical protein
MNKNFVNALAVGGALLLIGGGFYFYSQNRPTDNNTTDEGNTPTKTADGFNRTGPNSFGLDVCTEMSIEEVSSALGKAVKETRGYSNDTNTGCEYFISGTEFVIVDISFTDMATQRQGLITLGRTIQSEPRIGLENMLASTDKGLVDVYMNIEPGQKFARVGRTSTTVTTEGELIDLAIAVENKIRSYE